jgi:hypothetical protein
MLCDEWKVIIMILSLNVCLSLVQFLLEKIKDKTKTNLDNMLYVIVIKIEDTLKWVMAKRR